MTAVLAKGFLALLGVVIIALAAVHAARSRAAARRAKIQADLAKLSDADLVDRLNSVRSPEEIRP